MNYTVVDGSKLVGLAPAEMLAIAQLLFSTAEHVYTVRFGTGEEATATLLAWLTRSDSEFWLGNSRIALDPHGRVAGGYFHLSGDALAKARAADFLTRLRTLDKVQRQSYQAFVRATNELAPKPPESSEFLIGIGVLPAHRGRGLGRSLMRDWLREGRERGVKLFHLTVSGENSTALALYAGFGFISIGRGFMPSIGASTVAMKLET